VAADRGERENGSACRKAEGSIPKARLRKPRHNLTPTQPHALCTLHRVDKQQVGEQEGKMAAAVEEELEGGAALLRHERCGAATVGGGQSGTGQPQGFGGLHAINRGGFEG